MDWWSPDWVSAGASVLGAIAGTLATAFVVVQLWLLRRDSRITSKAALTTAYDSISQGSDRLTTMFAQNPHLYRIFWDEVEAATPEEQAQSMAMAEMHLDFIDSVVEQERDLSDHMDWSTWDVYFRALYRDSSTMRQFIAENFDYYPDYMYRRLGLIVVRDDMEHGRMTGLWRAFDCRTPSSADAEPPEEAARAVALLGKPLPTSGFPWITTWLFERIDITGEPVTGDGADAARVVMSVSDVRPVRVPGGMWHFWRSKPVVAAFIDVARAGSPKPGDLKALRGWVAETMRSSEIGHVQFADLAPATEPAVAMKPLKAGAHHKHNYVSPEPEFRAVVPGSQPAPVQPVPASTEPEHAG